jgi:ribosomal protein L7/L12
MQYHYRVSIPLQTITRATIEGSEGYGVENNLQLEDVLRTRVENAPITEGRLGTLGITTYLDIDITAENRKDAMLKAVSIAQLFIQLIALVHQAEFEINLAGIRSVTLTPDANIEPSAYLGVQVNIASFERLLPVWKKVAAMQEQNNELWKVLRLTLEWLHFGAIANEERSVFLAYRIALEVLLKGTEGDESPVTVFQKYLDKKKYRLLAKAIRAVLALYFDDAKAIDRLMQYIERTLAESDAERWARTLNKAGVSVSSKELDDLGIARGSVVHSGISSAKMSITRVREIVIAYINALLGVGELNEE